MGVKTRDAKPSDTPAPSAYGAPSALGTTYNAKQKSAPTYSMGARLKKGGFSDDIKKTPAPGTYNADPVHKKRSPAYSMSSRNFGPQDRTKKPGPGAHSPEKVTVHKKRQPAFSMGVRHSEYIAPLIVDVPDN
jgi:beta-lactam-binding protein with PASTA domain